MKKKWSSGLSALILTSINLMSQVSYAQEAPIVLKLDIPEPKITKNIFTYENLTYDSITVKSLDKYGAPGKPVMPFKTVRILLPQDSDLEGVEIITGKKITLDGRYRIEYGKTPVPLIARFDSIPEDKPSKEIYSSATAFPDKLYLQLPLQNFRGYKILILNLHPVQYIPKEGLLSYFKEMTVKVNLKPTEKISPLFRNLSKDRAEVIKKVDNPGIVNTYTKKAELPHKGCICDPCESFDYVIITSDDLKNSSGDPNFQDLIDLKAQKGIRATIVTVEEIESDTDYDWDGAYGDGDSFFDDTAAHIRNFIKDAFINWHIDYVLLAGDGDGDNVGGESDDNIIPARSFYAFYRDGGTNDQIPADLYYAALDPNCNWNNDHDSYWGEDGEEDFYAEVYVGRAPVDSEQEVSNFVRKTIAYEKSCDPYLNKAYMVGEWLGFGEPNLEYATKSKDEVRLGSSAHGYTTAGFPETFDVGTLYDSPGYSWPKSEVISIINSGTHLINHLGHSYTLWNMKLCNAPFEQEGPHCGTSHCTDVDDLVNTKYCFIYSQGCYPGAFDNWAWEGGTYTKSDSIGEHFVTSEHGAFAVVMNSRFGWPLPGSTNGPSQHYDREFWDAIFGEGITNLGKANQDSKEDNIGFVLEAHGVSQEEMKYCYYTLNLLGDPEVQIWTTRQELLSKVDNVNDGDSVRPNDDITYTITYANPVTNPQLTGVTITDYLPEEVDPNNPDPNYNSSAHTYTWHIGTLSPGESNTITLTVIVNDLAEPMGTITNLCVFEANEVHHIFATETTDVNFWNPGVIYVDKDAITGSNNGMSWDNAYRDLQDALARARAGCGSEIWVAAGTYKPTQNPTDTDATFQLVDGVPIYGGFAGNETSRNQRNYVTNQTILSGDIDNYGIGDVWLVVTASNVGQETIIDGFTITKGAAVGIYCNGSSPTIAHNTIKENYYFGIYCDGASPTITQNTIEQNNNRWGIYCINNSFPDIKNCLIQDNADGGIGCVNSDLIVADCIIADSNYGCGIYCESDSSVNLTNNVIRFNGNYGIYLNDMSSATIKNNWIHNSGYGGILFINQVYVPIVRNNTIYDNFTYGIELSECSADPNISNCIIYGNGTEDLSWEGTVNYCCLQSIHSGTGNIYGDPCFMNPTNPNDLHIDVNSLCKNAGAPNSNYDGETDIDGEGRVKYGRVDIGGDEYYLSPADFDDDLTVNFFDYAIFANAWRSYPGDPNWDPNCDIGAPHNLIDYNDLAAFCEDWLWQAGWTKTFTCGAVKGMIQTMAAGFAPAAVSYPSVLAEQQIEKVEPLKIEQMIKWLEELWLDPEVRKLIDEDIWLKFIESLKDEL